MAIFHFPVPSRQRIEKPHDLQPHQAIFKTGSQLLGIVVHVSRKSSVSKGAQVSQICEPRGPQSVPTPILMVSRSRGSLTGQQDCGFGRSGTLYKPDKSDAPSRKEGCVAPSRTFRTSSALPKSRHRLLLPLLISICS